VKNDGNWGQGAFTNVGIDEEFPTASVDIITKPLSKAEEHREGE
jgi:hypothetical protein